MAEQNPSDEELVQRMRTGEEDCFAALYDRWQRPIYRFALQMTGSPAIAEDVTQETFLVVIRENQYRPSRGSFGAYLYGVARHLLLRVIKRESRIAVTSEDELQNIANTIVSPAFDPHEGLLRKRRVELLWAAILALPVHYREVIIMCELHEMGYTEVAEVLDLSIGTVRSRLHRARATLTQRMQNGRLNALAVPTEPDGCAI